MKRRMLSLASVAMFGVLVLANFSAAQDETPVVAKKPRPEVYDEKADAKADLAAATAKAAADNKRVLVVFGGNWCGWCIKLHELCKQDVRIAMALSYEYEVVRVDIGKSDKNQDLVAGAAEGMKASGVPYLAVLGADGKVLALQDTGSLEVGNKHDPQKVLAFLDKHKTQPLDAETVLKAATDQAAREQKLVMVHLGAPW